MNALPPYQPSAQDRQDVDRLCAEALALPLESRARHVETNAPNDWVRREALEMLAYASEMKTGFLENSPVLPGIAGARFAGSLIGALIGPYRVRSVLGEGGFGVVYLADQVEPLQRRVALKVIKPGMDSKGVLARFEAERQALALMNHPCVARVFDAGTTDRSLPYFVMELVEGEPINDFCDRNRLSLVDRIILFISVCEAVQHAHSKGVIHRDLKPSNILVSYAQEGRALPKIIDFGIAKALNQRLADASVMTEQGQLIGTPEYMSPEQAEMGATGIDTRSDVYSLGVLLYELLTGFRPFDLKNIGLAEIQRLIREEDPPRPSTRLGTLAADDADTAVRIAQARRAELRTISGVLRRDLDWVVMKCLEKDRDRRYSTANDLAMELRRYLANEPVLAGPPSASYRARKFIRRHRTGVVAASMVAVALAGASIISVRFAIQADRQRAAAEVALRERSDALAREAEQRKAAETAGTREQQRAEELQQVADFQSGQLAALDPKAMGDQLRRSILEALDQKLRPDVERSLASINFTNVALAALEINVFKRSIEAIDAGFAQQPALRATLLEAAASTMFKLGLRNPAMDPQTRALELRRRELGAEHPDTLKSVNNMGYMLKEQGKLNEAEPFLREALDARRRVLGEEHPETLTSFNNMGFLLSDQGKLTEAEAFYRKALDGRRRIFGNDHASTLTSIGNMGSNLQDQGRLAEAEPYFREALSIRQRTLGPEDPSTLLSLVNMGSMLKSQGKLAEAEKFVREALNTMRRVHGDKHPRTLAAMNNLSSLLQDQGHWDEAERLLRQVLETSRSVMGNEHIYTIGSLNNLGTFLRQQGRNDEAEPPCREAMEIARRVFGAKHQHTLLFTLNVAGLMVATERHAEALELLAPLEPDFRATFKGANADRLAAALSVIGQARAATIQDVSGFAPAESGLLEAYSIYESIPKGRSVEMPKICQVLATLYTKWHASAPDAGHDKSAEKWRAKLEAAKTTRPE